jgi:NAD(P)-dependent dehydrogenase (short-subunit alcohol dehydrogenase family)
MDLALNDRHIRVTGGSKGIGFACALAFCQEGARASLAGLGYQRRLPGRVAHPDGPTPTARPPNPPSNA